jgi:ubiquinone/menaquinone biosynthesis C-methylase UbiE
VSSADARAESRRRWGTAAAGWRAVADEYARQTMPVSARLVDAIDPQPGLTVLELAAGVGDTGFLAAELIQPGGTLICTDFSPEMLSAAQARADALGVRNVRFRQVDAETALDFEAASLDAVICRWGFMLMADPQTALRECRRVLKPGGRLALAAWAGAGENPWTSLAGAALTRRGLVPPTEPGAPGMFAWASKERIAELLEDAGFVEHTVESLPFTYTYERFEAWWSVLTTMGLSLREALGRAEPDTREAIAEEVREAAASFTAPDGSLALPACTHVARAVA